MMEDKTKAGEYELDGGAHYRQLNDEVSALRDKLFEKDAEIERLQAEVKMVRKDFEAQEWNCANG